MRCRTEESREDEVEAADMIPIITMKKKGETLWGKCLR